MKTQLLINGPDYICKVITLYILILIELIGGAVFPLYDIKDRPHLLGGHKNDIFLYVMLGLQGFCQLFYVFWFFFMIWKTFPFQYGRQCSVCQKFGLMFLAMGINLGLFGAEKAVRLALLLGSEDVVSIWDNALYVILYWVRYVVQILFFSLLMKVAFDLGNPQYYKPQRWYKY